MEEGLRVPQRAISLAKQFLEASFDVVAMLETRTRLVGASLLWCTVMVMHACLREQ